jgi:hypothetical protein
MAQNLPGGPHEPLHDALDQALDAYQAGLCNIGPRERLVRLAWGSALAAGTAAGYWWMRREDLPPAWRLALALPLLVAAVGLEQARTHFCVSHGWAGTYNMDGGTRPVASEADRRADRAYTLSVLMRCVSVAAIAAVAMYAL